MRQAVNASQNKRPGGDAVLERISEMMFVDAVRRHVERLPDASTGWLYAPMRINPLTSLRNDEVARTIPVYKSAFILTT